MQLEMFQPDYSTMPSPVKGLSWAEYLHAVFVIGGDQARKLYAEGWRFEDEEGNDIWPQAPLEKSRGSRPDGAVA